MNKLNKIIISVIIGLITIIGFSAFFTFSESFDATYYDEDQQYYDNYYRSGESLWKNWDSLKTDPYLFCVEHDQSLGEAYKEYKIISKIKIYGNEATYYNESGNAVRTNKHDNNAIMGWILHQKKDVPNEYYADTDIQKEIWLHINDWISKNAKDVDGKLDNFGSYISGVTEPENWRDYANSYAKECTYALNNGCKLNNLLSTGGVKTTIEGDYIKVGEFQWEFPGNLTNVVVEVKNQNGQLFETSNLKYFYYEGVEPKTVDRASQIPSGKRFYILIPKTLNASVITKITAKKEVGIYTADIWFLEYQRRRS